MAIESKQTAPVDISSLPGRGQFPAIDTYVRPRAQKVDDGGLADALKSLGANLSGFAAQENTKQKAKDMENVNTYVQQAKAYLRANPNVKWDSPSVINSVAHGAHPVVQTAVMQRLGKDAFTRYSEKFATEYAGLTSAEKANPAYVSDWIRRKQDEATKAGGYSQGYSGGWNTASRSFFEGMLMRQRSSNVNNVRKNMLGDSVDNVNTPSSYATHVSAEAKEVWAAAKAASMPPQMLTSMFMSKDGKLDLDIYGDTGESIFGFDENTPTSVRVAKISEYIRNNGATLGDSASFDATSNVGDPDAPDPVKVYELIHGKDPRGTNVALREHMSKRAAYSLKFLGVGNSEFRTVNNTFKGVRGSLAAKNLNPLQQAFLNGISGPESAGKYNIRYTPRGGAAFRETGKHPRIYEWTRKGERSSAAGRYQFVWETWKDIAGSNVPFTRENQDVFALRLAERDYRKITKGGDLWRDLQTQPVRQVLSRLSGTWEGLGKAGGLNKAVRWFETTLAQAIKKGGQ